LDLFAFDFDAVTGTGKVVVIIDSNSIVKALHVNAMVVVDGW